MRWSAPCTLSPVTQAKDTPASEARSSIASPSFGLVKATASGTPAAVGRATFPASALGQMQYSWAPAQCVVPKESDSDSSLHEVLAG